MKKHTIKWMKTLAITALALSMGMAQPTMAASKKVTAAAAKKAYAKYIEKNKKEIWPYGATAACVDMNKDGIPELLLDRGALCTVYTYSKGKMKKLAGIDQGRSSSTGIYYNTSAKTVCLAGATTGGSVYRFYKISAGKATKVTEYRTKEISVGKYKYYIGKKTYSDSSWNSKLKKKLKSYKVTTTSPMTLFS